MTRQMPHTREAYKSFDTKAAIRDSESSGVNAPTLQMIAMMVRFAKILQACGRAL